MHTDHSEDPKKEDLIQDNPLVEMGYEPTEIGMSSVKRFTLVFFGFTIVMFGVVFGLFKVLRLDVEAADRARAEALPFQNRIPESPNPLLQSNVTAKADIAVMRKSESEVLHSYAWVDESKGKVRIPIDRAIEILAERGLPKTGANMDAVSKGTTAPEVLRAREAEAGGTVAP